MEWTKHLNAEVYTRLCNCKSLKSDIKYLVNAKWLSLKQAGKDKEGFSKEDALVSVLELLDCNGQFFELTQDEYAELCR